jgi:hypothetical protein
LLKGELVPVLRHLLASLPEELLVELLYHDHDFYFFPLNTPFQYL